MEPKQASFEGWAVIEIMGHQKEIGYVTTEAFGAAVLFRVDTPELPDREYILERSEWSDAGGRLPAGSTVARRAVPAKTAMVGPSSVFRMTPCTEAFAMLAIEQLIPRALILVKLPELKQIEAGAEEVWAAGGCGTCGGVTSHKPYCRYYVAGIDSDDDPF